MNVFKARWLMLWMEPNGSILKPPDNDFIIRDTKLPATLSFDARCLSLAPANTYSSIKRESHRYDSIYATFPSSQQHYNFLNHNLIRYLSMKNNISTDSYLGSPGPVSLS